MVGTVYKDRAFVGEKAKKGKRTRKFNIELQSQVRV